MPESDEIRTRPSPAARLRRTGFALLWLLLALTYLIASVSGHRPLALAAVGLMAGVLLAASGRRIAGMVLGLLLAGACVFWADSAWMLIYLPPLAAFAFMAAFFYRTLRPGEDPLITRVARRDHQSLPPGVAAYTRSLTQIWVACFSSLLLLALLLMPFLPADRWSRWVQGLGFLLPSGLFLFEYGYRHHRFDQRVHSSLPQLIANIISVIGEMGSTRAAATRPPAVPGRAPS